MTPEELAEHIRRVVAEAPPLPADVVEMLRRDRCPIVGRRQKVEAAS